MSCRLLRLTAFLTALSSVSLAGCSRGTPAQAEALPPPTVHTTTLRSEPLALTQELPGRVHPVRTAQVRARVAGIVVKRHFTEGADVREGQVLYQIDPAPFVAAVQRASAEGQRMEAAVAEAQATVQRYTPLARIEAVSQQDLLAAQTTLKTAQANLAAAKAEMTTARLNLDYATVRAPIAGRIGRSFVTEGALVGQGEATALSTIQQIDSVYVDITQPVADAMAWRQSVAAGKSAQDGAAAAARLTVKVEGVADPLEGKLLFSDISVDPTSSHVVLRGLIPNPQGLLLPGMYVRAVVGQGMAPAAILVPQRAVKFLADGTTTVQVVADGDKVAERVVRTADMHGGRWHIVEGLRVDERVIVDGPPLSAGTQVSVAAASVGAGQ